MDVLVRGRKEMRILAARQSRTRLIDSMGPVL